MLTMPVTPLTLLTHRSIVLCTRLVFTASCAVGLQMFGLFTALHRTQTRSSDENSVSLSVCLSNA